MTPDAAPAPASQMEQQLRQRMRLWALALLGLLVASALLAWAWTGASSREALRGLREAESQVAASRAAAVESWLKRQQDAVASVAGNPSVEPYLITRNSADGAGLAGYLRTYLLDVAQREGYLRGVSQVPANTERPPAPGLALIGADGQVLVGVGGPMPPATDLLKAGSSALVSDAGMQLQAGPVLRMVKPVSGGTASVYAVRLLDEEFRALLVQPGEAAGTAEQSILQVSGDKVIAVTARGGAAAGEPVSTDPLVKDALASPGETVEARDAAGRPWLVTARAIAGSNWSLLRARPASQLLGDIAGRRAMLMTSIISALALLGTLALLLWRNSESLRIAEGAAKEERLRAFLDTIANRQPSGIYVLSTDGRLSFANSIAKDWQAGAREGQGLDAAFGDAATEARKLVDAVRSGSSMMAQSITTGAQRLRLKACALDPQQPSGEILLVAEDLTELLHERERREASLVSLVHVLTGLIDARDPGSKGHSEKVSRVASAIATAKGMAFAQVDAIATAGELINIGKILVPSALLTKSTPLSADEIATVRQAMAQSAALLRPVPFDGPVAEWIEQMDEPDPPEAARILRLANSFVGMVSPRAHRPPMAIEAALAALATNADAADQPLITALRFWLDTQGGRAKL